MYNTPLRLKSSKYVLKFGRSSGRLMIYLGGQLLNLFEHAFELVVSILEHTNGTLYEILTVVNL